MRDHAVRHVGRATSADPQLACVECGETEFLQRAMIHVGWGETVRGVVCIACARKHYHLEGDLWMPGRDG